MRSEQKIILSCRQTGERAERLLEWLDQSRLMLKAQDRALRTEVQSIASELGRIIEAAEQPPTAAILGGWHSARVALIGHLLTETRGSAPEDDTRVALGRDRLLTLMPHDADGGQVASVRLVASARAESPYRFPIRISLLSQLDLVKIIASAYLVHVPPRQQLVLPPDVVARKLASQTDELGTQSFSGMARRDIDGVRDALHAAASESAVLRNLDAAGYWDTLGGLIPHLSDAARRQAFSILWGGDPTLTTLFGRLSDAIELLGFSGEAFAALDGFTGRNPSTGWIVRHEDSVIAASTLLRCHDAPERTVRVSSRHGRATDVERFVLAALASEVRLPVDPTALDLLETSDLLVLPATPPVLLWPPSDAGARPIEKPQTGSLSTQAALEIFAARKAMYLAELAISRHGVTSLLVVTDWIEGGTRSTIDAASCANIANWIELTQGETAHVRERRRTGLSILLPEPGAHAGLGESVFAMPQRAPALDETLVAVFDGNADWATEWVPNQPFRNIYTWQPTRTPARSGENAEAIHAEAGSEAGADILRFERGRQGEVEAGIAELGSHQSLASLLHALRQGTSASIHGQHLSARLVELRRALTARFLRLHISNDPIGIVEWRRQVCHVACNRLERSAGLGRFGRLQRVLLFSETEAQAVIARLLADDPRSSNGRVVDLRTIEPQRIVDRALEAWIVAMRQATRAQALMRALRVPGSIVAHIIDELALGAIRIGLQDKLTEAVRRIQRGAEHASQCERAVAALLERGINTYVETLDPGARSARGASSRDSRFGMSSGAHAVAKLTAPETQLIAAAWAEQFSDLVEANILGASLLGGAGHLNRELGEVLSAMSAQSYEGLS